ncbi:MAG: DUF4097 family beta strand repeat-containing protein [Oscillospiraceae bacterium]
MKSNSLIYIGIVSSVLGLLLFGLAFWQEGFNMNNFKTRNTYENKTYKTSESINSISITDSNVKINVTTTASTELSIEYMETQDKNYNITLSEDGKLRVVKNPDTTKWYHHIINLDFSSPLMTIHIPKSFTRIQNIDIATSNSTITADSITADDINLTTSNAKIDVAGATSKNDFVAKTSNSEVKISNCTADSITATSSNGGLSLTNSAANTCNMKTTNSRIILTTSSISNSLYATTANAKIELDMMSSPNETSLITSNGEVSGTMIGNSSDFSYDCTTTNATSNLPSNMTIGEKSLKIKTSNAKINLEFIAK